jgi:hypothetical protein
MWEKGVMIDLGILGGYSETLQGWGEAYDINPAGQVVGYSTGRATLWTVR